MSNSHPATSQRVRDFFGTVPQGAQYMVTTMKTLAGGARPDGAKDHLDSIYRELRAANRDPGVTNITVLIMYDGPEDGSGMAERAQLLLPLGTQP